MSDHWDNHHTHARVFANLHWLHRDSKVDVVSAIMPDYDRDSGEQYAIATGPIGIIRVRLEDYEAVVAHLRMFADGIERFMEEMF